MSIDDASGGGVLQPETWWTPTDLWARLEQWSDHHRLAGRDWVCRGELVDVRERSGGWVVARLVDQGGAQIEAVTPPWMADKLRDHLDDGVSAGWVVQLELHPQWGKLQLRIENFVAGSVRSGDRAAELAAAWALLEPHADTNAGRPMPVVPRRVAVVTAPSAAGWGDLQAELADEPRLEVELLPARMGGERAAGEIIDRLRSPAVVAADVALIARGGGGGREWADDPDLAQAIIDCPTRVWTAIGHADDHHLADRLSAASFPAPAAAGARLVELWAKQDAARAREEAVEAARAEQTRLVREAAPASRTVMLIAALVVIVTIVAAVLIVLVMT